MIKMKKYVICKVEGSSGNYKFWDGRDSDGSRHYDNEDFISYFDDGMAHLIPLPDDVYHAIAYYDKDDSSFYNEDKENILSTLDPIGFDMFNHTNKPEDEVYVMDDGLCSVYVFYDNEDRQYALDKLEEFFNSKD